MTQIASAGNTEIPCYLVLQELGFKVSRDVMGDTEIWTAEKSDLLIRSEEGPCMLLGLAKLIEIKGEEWRAPDDEIDRFMSRFYGSNG